MIFNDPGTYQIEYTATDECGNETVAERTVIVEEPPIYGAEWNGGESPVWTRTDRAALFADPVPQISDGNGGWTVGSSPFDDIMPWSGMEIIEDENVGTLVKIPKFWYKWTRNGSAMKLQISSNPASGFLTSPAHADRGDGVGERDVVYVGRYHCSKDDYKSSTGVRPKSSVTRDTFRTNIHLLGNDIWQYDFAMYWTIAMLYLVEFANWDSQEMIGYGCGSSFTSYNAGSTDAMTYHTGTTASALTTYGDVQYRHIEGLWSGAFDFCDGIYFSGSNIYVINNPSDFSDSTGGTNVGNRVGSNGLIKSFTNPSSVLGYEYALYVASSGGSDYSKYVCDEVEYNGSGTVLYTGGTFDYRGNNYGLFRMCGRYTASNSPSNVSSRLMKLPSA